MASSTTHHQLIADAHSVVESLRKGVPTLGSSHADRAEELATSIEGLGKSLEWLHSNEHNPGSILSKPLKIGEKLFFDKGTSLQEAQKRVTIELVDAIASTKNSHVHATIQKNVSAAAAKAAEAAELKGPGFFGRMVSGGFNKHQDWMKKHSAAGRMGFAVAELTLGNVLTAVGGQWLSQGISGLKQKQMQQHTTDEKGGRITDTVLVMSPMSKTERVLKTALGGASAGIGIAATGMGFYNLFFSTESN